MRGGVELGVVDLAEFRAHGEGQSFLVEVEPGVHAGLVAARVEAGPARAAGQPQGDQAVDDGVRSVVVGEALVAQGTRDALGAQQGDEGVRFGVADAVARTEDVGRAPGDARVAGITRVRDGVADELEGSLGV